MKITKEFREWIHDFTTSSFMRGRTINREPASLYLCGLANNIDQAHEKALDEVNPYLMIARKTPLTESDVRSAVERYVARKEDEWIELPKDSEGNILRVGDTVKVENGYSGGFDEDPILKIKFMNFTDHWELMDLSDRAAVTPEYCTLLKAPYDKTGREIKVGDWISFADCKPRPITGAHRDNCGRWYLTTTIGDYKWSPEQSGCFEIVPAPDTIEQIEADAKKVSSQYFECANTRCSNCEHGTVLSGQGCDINQRLDLIRRTKAVCGGE